MLLVQLEEKKMQKFELRGLDVVMLCMDVFHLSVMVETMRKDYGQVLVLAFGSDNIISLGCR